MLFILKKGLVLLLSIIVLVIVTFYPVSSFGDKTAIVLHGLFFLLTFICYFPIRKLEVDILNIGWQFVVYGFFIHTLNQIFIIPAVLEILFEGVITVIGFTFITLGIIKSVRKFKEFNNRYISLFRSNHLVMLLIDSETGEIVDANQAAFSFYGYSRDELIGKKIGRINTISEEEHFKEIERVQKEEKKYFQFKHRLASGEIRDVEIYSGPILIDGKEVLYSIIHDITDKIKAEKVLKENEERLKYLSFHDHLTGLYNRRYIENEMDRLNSSRLLPISLIMADLDDLKIVNDNYGHKTGDRAIKDLADIIRSVIRKEDIVGRIGGDEFLIILPETDKNTAEEVCQRIQKKVKFHNRDQDFRFSVSTGCATKCNNGIGLDRVLIKADRLMYKAKIKKTHL